MNGFVVSVFKILVSQISQNRLILGFVREGHICVCASVSLCVQVCVCDCGCVCACVYMCVYMGMCFVCLCLLCLS